MPHVPGSRTSARAHRMAVGRSGGPSGTLASTPGAPHLSSVAMAARGAAGARTRFTAAARDRRSPAFPHAVYARRLHSTNTESNHSG